MVVMGEELPQLRRALLGRSAHAVVALAANISSKPQPRRRYTLYGEAPSYEHEADTDFAAIAEGLIAVTPIHFDLTDQAGVEELAGFDLERLLRPATEAVE